MFVQNKYTKWYFELIGRGLSRNLEGYGEMHHIVPRSLGGLDDKSNLVKLTAREHFLCHWLLTKMTRNDHRNKMVSALYFMSKHPRHLSLKTSRVYETLKGQAYKTEETRAKMRKPKSPEHAAKIAAYRRSAEARMAVSKLFKGKPKSSDQIEKIRAKITGKTRNDDQRMRISASHIGHIPWNKGVRLSEEQKASRHWHTCSICRFQSQNLTVIVKYHNQNCKQRIKE